MIKVNIKITDKKIEDKTIEILSGDKRRSITLKNKIKNDKLVGVQVLEAALKIRNTHSKLLKFKDELEGNKKETDKKAIVKKAIAVKDTVKKVNTKLNKNLDDKVDFFEYEEEKEIALEKPVEKVKETVFEKPVEEEKETVFEEVVEPVEKVVEEVVEEKKSFFSKVVDKIKYTLFGKPVEKKLNSVEVIPYVMEGESHITLYLGTEMIVLHNDHENFEKIKQLLSNEKYDKVRSLLNKREQLESILIDGFEIRGDSLFYNDSKIDGALSSRIIDLATQDKEHKSLYPFLKFLKKVEKNPMANAVEDLYTFLANAQIPITRTGNIVVYKKIKKNWTDCYSGTFDNSIGATPEMKRTDVNDNRNVTCSSGLHVAAWSYMKSFGGERIILCEVNPKDVVSVPVDYNNAKMRVCKYKVIKEVTKEELKDIIIF